MSRFGFVGVGNMGGAMIDAITKKFEGQVAVFDVDQSQYKKFEASCILGCKSIKELIQASEYIVLSVKPQYYESVCKELKELIKKEQVVITVAPGISLEKMEMLLGGHTKLVRTMPNTPALVG
ncbi:MAG: NAD(P)-binding domain-containing protein, partial [Niameybacter sp.]